MTELDRTDVASALLAVVFSMRPDDSEAGQAWVLNVMTTGMARAILASVGPAGDPTDLLELTRVQVAKAVIETQSKFFRDKLTVAARV